MLTALALAAAIQAAPAPPPPGEKPVDPYVQDAANAGATPLADGGRTFRAFHGREGVERVCAAFVARNLADPRIRDVFAAADVARLRRTLAEQFCYLLGGPCAYTGRDMRGAHVGQGLQTSDFNAVVENLQAAMDGEGVPFAAQNRLLAKLAPMQRAVVERRSPAALHKLARRLRAALAAPAG